MSEINTEFNACMFKQNCVTRGAELARQKDKIRQLEQELAEAKAALAAQAQQPTELSDKCKVAASCLTYNDTEKEAVAKHLLLEASQELRRAQAQHNQWISVEERLPEKFVDVLVHPRPTDYICEAAWLGDAWYWSDYELNFGVITNKCVVTHWMPLPPAPPEGDKEWN